MAQINPIVGDIAYNEKLIIEAIDKGKDQKLDLLLFPELAICGYPPEDLVYREDFLNACYSAVFRIMEYVKGGYMTVCLGFPDLADGHVYNAMAVLDSPGRVATYYKMHLPNYSVFDERRHFTAGEHPETCKVGHLRQETIGLTICEDIWVDGGPHIAEARAGAQMIVNISASPYHYGKGKTREALLRAQTQKAGVPIFYCNMWGGQDELIFDGQSLAVDANGDVIARGKQFADDFVVCEVDLEDGLLINSRAANVLVSKQAASDEEEVYMALTLGVRDYLTKNGFGSAILGLSGGVDSTLVALVAADAIGAENVTALVMPSKFSSDATQGDAHIMAENLGLNCIEIPIETLAADFEDALKDQFIGTETDVTEENIQARARGTLLMAMSNKFGSLLLSTGNKSEMSVGYATLYGDMAGGFAVLKDVPKTMVFDLIRWRNAQDEQQPIPDSIIDRPPSAELAEDQADTDSLPPYEILDGIIKMYVEEDASVDDISKQYGEA